jgi:chromosome segregation ATPase
MKRTILVIAMAALAPSAHATYKCVDENGRTHIGDTPPPGCANVPLYEMSRSGAVLRRIEPTPTTEQLKAREEQAKRQREAEQAAAAQKRKDDALLSTFASEREFDTARDRNIEPLASRIRSAQERIRAVDQRLAKIDEEMEFYTPGKSKSARAQVPASLVAEQERLNHEKQVLAANITGYERDIVAQREKFDADRKRWLELKAASGRIETPRSAAK